MSPTAIRLVGQNNSKPLLWQLIISELRLVWWRWSVRLCVCMCVWGAGYMLLQVINNHQTVVEGVNIFYSLCFVLIKLISRFIQLSSPIWCTLTLILPLFKIKGLSPRVFLNLSCINQYFNIKNRSIYYIITCLYISPLLACCFQADWTLFPHMQTSYKLQYKFTLLPARLSISCCFLVFQ